MDCAKLPLLRKMPRALALLPWILLPSCTAFLHAFTRAVRPSSARLGVIVDTLEPGDGKIYPKQGDFVTAHYTGKTVPDVGLGFVFDSSRGGEPLEFQIGVGQVIKGWDEGIMKMSLGERATLTCTPDYAYGAAGAPPDIPPDATLEFDVELVGVENF